MQSVHVSLLCYINSATLRYDINNKESFSHKTRIKIDSFYLCFIPVPADSVGRNVNRLSAAHSAYKFR